MTISRKSLRCIFMALIFSALVVAVIVYLTIPSGDDPELYQPPNPDDLPYFKAMEPWIYPEEKVSKGAIVSNGGPCAEMGMKIMQKYGNAVDAAITTLLCDGVTSMEYMGIGGGFVATLYIKKENKIITLNAREVAPMRATKDMFLANKTLSQIGGLSVAVPGEIRGYWEMYNKYGGSAKWEELFEDTIKLCEEGVPVTFHLNRSIGLEEKLIRSMPGLSELMINEKGELPKIGDKIKFTKLANTFRIIAKEGPDAFYNGSLTAGIIKDINDNGGIMTPEDFANYNAIWEEPVSVKLSNGDTVHSVPAPSSGPILHLILKILDNELPPNGQEPETTFKITEAFKFGFGIRSLMGDPNFVDISDILAQIDNVTYIQDLKKKLNVEKTSNDINYYGSSFVEDHGTANVVVVAPNGDALSVTSTVNTRFASGLISQSTGILLNNEMDDFATPGLINYFGVAPSEANFIAPRKMPLSSMVPSIVVDKNGQPKLVIGAAGGTKITTSVALTIIRNIWFNKNLTEAVREPRFHHQLVPMRLEYEPHFDRKVLREMKNRGHKIEEGNYRASCITAIEIKGPILAATADMRRPGNTSYLFE